MAPHHPINKKHSFFGRFTGTITKFTDSTAAFVTSVGIVLL